VFFQLDVELLRDLNERAQEKKAHELVYEEEDIRHYENDELLHEIERRKERISTLTGTFDPSLSSII
jgi:hypothetical protein